MGEGDTMREYADEPQGSTSRNGENATWPVMGLLGSGGGGRVGGQVRRGGTRVEGLP